jgi:hypothetical protein
MGARLGRIGALTKTLGESPGPDGKVEGSSRFEEDLAGALFLGS